ncbi:MAG: LptF/LptG family permease [Candidatus Sumerlaeota bacterium]|nr:LptF/LptG family permease [Candidatus Sumerlaeota bacterium]
MSGAIAVILLAFAAGGVFLWFRGERGMEGVHWPGFAILQRYVLTETIGPVLLSTLALTFFLLVRVIYEMMKIIMQPGAAGPVLQVMLFSLPQFFSFTVPISILLGVLLGIGRLALENEIRAMQVAGVHLGRIFWPLITLCAMVSGLMILLNYEYAPKMAKRGKELKTQLVYQALSALPEGIPNNKYKIEGNDTVFYFRGRDPKNNDMLQVCLMTEFQRSSPKSKESGKPTKGETAKTPTAEAPQQSAAAPVRAPSGLAWAAEVAPQIPDLKPKTEPKIRPKGAAAPSPAPRRAPASAPLPPASVGKAKAAAGAAPGVGWSAGPTSARTPGLKTPGQGNPNMPQTEPVKPTAGQEHRVIFAARGRVVADAASRVVNLELDEGSIFPLGPDYPSREIQRALLAGDLKTRGVPPIPGRDETLYFKRLQYRIDLGAGDEAPAAKEYTFGEIRAALRQGPLWPYWRGESPKTIAESKRKLEVDLASRTAIPLACVAFALLAVPLAIFVRPSGKSWGVAISFALILVYYWMIKSGSSMAEEGRNLGFVIIFLPNLLMAALGAYLFRRAVRM